jgi:hypothetical protein
MRNPFNILISLSILACISYASSECRFAKYYTFNNIRNPEIRKTFIENVFKWESKFVRELGVDKISGLTLDGW